MQGMFGRQCVVRTHIWWGDGEMGRWYSVADERTPKVSIITLLWNSQVGRVTYLLACLLKARQRNRTSKKVKEGNQGKKPS